MTPQISEIAGNETYSYRQPNLTYRLGTKTVAGKIDKLESIKQAVYHILSTERYSNQIYDDNYGVELEQYIGKDIGFITASIENTLREAICQDDRITDIQVDNVEKSSTQNNACLVEFTVFTIYGNYSESLNVING